MDISLYLGHFLVFLGQVGRASFLEKTNDFAIFISEEYCSDFNRVIFMTNQSRFSRLELLDDLCLQVLFEIGRVGPFLLAHFELQPLVPHILVESNLNRKISRRHSIYIPLLEIQLGRYSEIEHRVSKNKRAQNANNCHKEAFLLIQDLKVTKITTIL